MINPREKARLDDRKVVVAELRSLAGLPQLRPRAVQLGQLAADLESGKRLERWAEIDLTTTFLRPETVLSQRRSRIGGLLDLAPIGTIFLPILITWFGLVVATRAYRSSRGDPALKGLSFLQQWQTGFGGRLAEPFYFDQIAFWTLTAVVLVICVSLLQAGVRRRRDHDEEHERTDLLNRLGVVLTAVDLWLAEYRMNDGSRLNEGAEKFRMAAAEIQEAGTAVREVHTEILRSLEDVRGLVAQVGATAESLQRLQASLGETAERVGDGLTELSTATGAVAASAGDLAAGVRSGGEDLRQAAGSAADELRAALTEWRIEGAIYSHRHESAADRLGVIVGSVEDLMRRIAAAVDTTSAAARQLDGFSSEALQGLKAAVTDGITQIKAVLDDFRVALPDDRGRQTDLIREVASLSEALDRLRTKIDKVRVARPWRFGRRS